MREPKSSWDYLTDLMAAVPGLNAMFSDARPEVSLGTVKSITEKTGTSKEDGRATAREFDESGS